jgi:hypothetical protein
MSIIKIMADVFFYLSEGATALFTPSRDEYPKIGVQPFDGEPYSEWVSASDDLKNKHS